ncbi:peptide transporter [Thermococcus profundus]|uniref:dolichyl-phosphooligosaccharide-protein glycotransferase n=1 Tax=Thermococcus profundus TaxID=49899 RepID=A0A2Z2MMG6_THEPR|nr:STT3 domain-containing protein [Thermococcus profundus]ASJ03621.1 peptide transporter [Thermococcus profundus]
MGRKKKKTDAGDTPKRMIKSPQFPGWSKRLIPFLIFLMALTIRLIPYRLKYLVGYDPYFHLAYLEYASQHGWVNYFPYALGPWGFLINHFHPKGMWLTPYSIYRIGNPFGLSIEGAFKLTPPILGALTVLLVYYMMKKLYSWKEASLSALILALSFGHVFRSMSSYYRGDNYALFWYSATLVLMGYGLNEKEDRRKVFIYLTAGLVAGFSSAFWSAYYVVLALPLLVSIALAAYSLFRGGYFGDSTLTAASTAVGALMASALGHVFGFGMFWIQNWQGEQLRSITGLSPGPLEDVYLTLHLLVLVPLTLALTASLWAVRSRLPEGTRRTGTIGVVALVTVIFVAILWKYGGTMEILSAGLSSFGSAATAEMSRPGWWDIKMAYHAFLAFLPFYLLSFRHFRVRDAFILGVSAPLIALAFYWTRFLFIGSLGVSLAAGIGASELVELTGRWNMKKAGVALIIVLVILGGYHGVKAAADVKPIVDENWASALIYLKGISNENDIVLTWWDHGHWVTYFAHRAAVAQGTPSKLVSRFYLGNASREELLELGVDYVTVSFDTILKWGSVKSTAGYTGSEYVLIPLFPSGVYGDAVIFANGPYQVGVRKAENGTWSVLVNVKGNTFIPEEVWIESGDKPFRANVTGKKAGNAYLYVNLKYGYAVLMDGRTFSTPFARLMFTSEYSKEYRLVYSDGGRVKIFQLLHPNVVLDRSNGLVLRFTNATGDRLRIYGYTDSGKRVFYREYNVSGLSEFRVPETVPGDVIRYTYLKGSIILDRGVFRRSGGWS